MNTTTGRQKIEAAFSREGTRDIAAVLCYEEIFIRDHWEQLSAYPWWYKDTPDIERQMLWRSQVIARTGQDWFSLPFFYSAEERSNLAIEVRPDGVFRLDRRTGRGERLEKPQIGGWSDFEDLSSARRSRLPESPGEIDAMISIPPKHDPNTLVANGNNALAARLSSEYGKELYPFCYVDSPLWGLYHLCGFEGMMIMIATRPELVKRACRRFLILQKRAVREGAALGAAGIWISECLTDMISPGAFAALNVPILQEMVQAIRAAGLKSIYGYCGDPKGKWDHLLSVGADALALEESKKNFTIEIEEVVGKVQGRCAVLGNLDAIGVLQDGTEASWAELSRQIAAGQRNGGRFIMCTGSPVTPGTLAGKSTAVLRTGP